MAETKVTQNEMNLSSGLQTYTNTGTLGGTGYYINEGGIKKCWGYTTTGSLTSGQSISISLPSSFFTTVQYWDISVGLTGAATVGMAPNATQPPNGTALSAWFTTNTTSTVGFKWYVIGT